MPRFKSVNGQRIQFTAEEEAQADARQVAWEAGAFDRDILRLRSERTRLLSDTDFYALSDVVMSDAMKTYRQDLRDLPAGLTTVEQVKAVVWPTKP